MSSETIKWFCNMTMLGYTLQNSWKATWKCLNGESYPHQQYSPDIALSNYHLFWLMAYGLAEQHWQHCYEDVKKKKK